jgi:cell division septation protein DedD
MRRLEGAMKSSSGQISITRSHIGAMLTATAGVAAIAFFVGVDVGRNQVSPGEAPRLTLLPDAASDDALEALLREVEAAQQAANTAEPPNGFRAVLAEARAAEPPPPEAAPVDAATVVEEPVPVDPAVVSDEPVTTIPAPEAAAADAGGEVRPMDGWAVQIASYHTMEEAEAKVKELEAAGYPAYEVTALVKGVTWYRVRIAGYLSQEVAYEALPTLEQALGTHGLVVAKAP